ncbi:terminase gpA endonuclease subunit [Rhizobacter sp. SG703]|uniref:phage terminase large subunit family protein n=1 Tax=Rhizobacter sp. SG703 TaxID=2587140 RepID=UPI0014456FD5|nr:terminase gpA endonuclease subunit [Rhizobacter sp. SG703]NKI97550.1 phage terminase large subunit GpA-like protein [Rhizobacter sp. SG703]
MTQPLEVIEINRPVTLADLGTEQRDEINAALRRGLRPLEAPPPMRLSQWMAEHFYLSEESSYEQGRWEAYPYQIAIADCIGHDEINHVTWRKSARTGYTKIFLAAVGYFAEHKRRNQAVYQPTDEDRDDFVTTELEPMLRDVRVMRRVFPKFNRKSKENTIKKKRFLGCLLHLRGGKAAKNYRRITVDCVYYDETDGFDRDIEKEGSPFRLGDKRIEGATFPKSVAGSTPKLKGFSLIEDRESQADVRFQYFIRCPHCDDEHTLDWGGKEARHGMKWTDGDPETVGHVCPHCGVCITQAEYLAAWKGRWKSAEGLWIDERDPVQLRFRNAADEEIAPPRHVAFFSWTAYSPQATWVSIVRDWLTAAKKAQAGDDSDLKTFINTTRGETYEQELEKTDASQLALRGKHGHPLRIVPRGAVKLAIGVDVQGDRWELVVWGFGRGEEMWVVDDLVIYGNPADQREWDLKLDPAIKATYRHVCGVEMSADAVAIDTGGHYTHQCYVFVRNRPNQNLYAVKGETRLGRPIKSASVLVDVNERGKTIRKGVRLWHVGTDTAKDLLYGRLQVSQPGPGYVHFARELTAEFYDQLTAESRMLVKSGRGEEHRWLKPAGKRNEKLDCTVYALFCAQMLGLHTLSDKLWARLEAGLEPDLFAPMPSAIDTAMPTVQASAPIETRAPPPPAARPLVPQLTSSPIASNAWSSRL